MTETHLEKPLIGSARVSTYEQTLEAHPEWLRGARGSRSAPPAERTDAGGDEA